MFSQNFKRWSRRIVEQYIAPVLSRLRLTPNVLTLIGVILTGGVAIVLANGRLFLGGWLLVFASIFDLFDGAVARTTNQTSTFGAFFDSIMDRYSEAIVFLGLLVYFHQLDAAQSLQGIMLVYVAIIGSLMVSYARARAEGLNIACETGWLGRPERLAILCSGLVFGFLTIALWILAILTNFTAIQRIYHVWKHEQLANPELKPKTARRPLFGFFVRPEK